MLRPAAIIARMAAVPNFLPSYKTQVMPTENPIILQINDTITRTLPAMINLGLPFPLMPITISSIVPNPEKIHAIMIKVRVIINFKHNPRNGLNPLEQVKRAAKHSSKLCLQINVLQPRHKPTVRDSSAIVVVPLKCTNKSSTNLYCVLS